MVKKCFRSRDGGSGFVYDLIFEEVLGLDGIVWIVYDNFTLDRLVIGSLLELGCLADSMWGPGSAVLLGDFL